MNVYTMVNVSDQAAAVESLPPVPHVSAGERCQHCVSLADLG
jgi:hypothetical protein